MDSSNPFCNTDETQASLMRATYAALCKHGYANITIQRIGDEFPKSKSLIYQHYDSKDELLVAFLRGMIEHMETEVPVRNSTDARDQLETFLDRVFAPFDDERSEFMSAMIELRAQAAHSEAYRDHFTKSDRLFHAHIADIIQQGIDQGAFQKVDPDRTADYLQTMIDGAMLRRTTTDETVDITNVRHDIEEYMRWRLIDDDE